MVSSAVETLSFLERSGGFPIQPLVRDDYTRGQAIFRRRAGVELPDAITAAYVQRADLEDVYSFDDDFDRFDWVTRPTTATNPFDPDDVE